MDTYSTILTFIDMLAEILKTAGNYNKNDQTSPVVILWTDKERQWVPLLPRLRDLLPLLTFDPGTYDPAEKRGPAYYMRCMVARSLPDHGLPDNQVPIIYLPGVSKQELRAVEDCPKPLQPLAELQYRGLFWTQKNGKDWTIAAFLQSKDGGLGIDVAGDQATRDALRQTLKKLADTTIEDLRKNAPIKDAYLYSLVNKDDVRSLLSWINDPEGYRRWLTPEEWKAFCGITLTKYQINPEKDGVITAAERLGQKAGIWNLAWERYLEAPQSYPHITERLRSARPTQLSLFDRSETWPQDNEAEENQLRQDLLELRESTFQHASAVLLELEKRHAQRREWAWARLGLSPLAFALKHLILASEAMQKWSGGTTLEDLTVGYCNNGWQADNEIVATLAAVEDAEDTKAVKSAIYALYRPWLETLATAFQKAAGKSYHATPLPLPAKGTCVIFSDALRMDVAQRMADELQRMAYISDIQPHLAALPPITATAKPALLEVDSVLSGAASSSLDPVLKSATSPLTAEAYRTLLAERGFQILKEDDYGDPAGRGWTEMGQIDAYGHGHGTRLAYHLEGEILALEKRVTALLEYGWKQVMVITDHGWLLVPYSLPKAELPEHLTILRKGRCARLKDGARTDFQTLPWFWDNDVLVAFAPGISCFEAGKEYEHGGLSPQECITPVMTIRKTASSAATPVQITGISWKGLRCSVNVQGASQGMVVDLRAKAGDGDSSLAITPKEIDNEGQASLVVEDEDREGSAAFVVVINESGQLLAQQLTTIGG